VDVLRHFTRISRKNYALDLGLYPLGSCTMKYNPRLNERIAALSGYSAVHPRMSDRSLEGWLEVAVELRRRLLRLVGLEEISLLHAAGAQGEWVGLRVIGAFHRANGDDHRRWGRPQIQSGSVIRSLVMPDNSMGLGGQPRISEDIRERHDSECPDCDCLDPAVTAAAGRLRMYCDGCGVVLANTAKGGSEA
jgi:hypothetical protein